MPTSSPYNPHSRWPSLVSVGAGGKPSIVAGSQEEVVELLPQFKPNEKRRGDLGEHGIVSGHTDCKDRKTV